MHNHYTFLSKDFMKISLRKSANILKVVAVAALLFAAGPAKAQCPPASSDITQYTFSTGVGTASDWLTPASVTTYMTSQDDAASSVYNLNFTFTFEK